MVIRIEWGADRLRVRRIILSLVAFLEHCFGPVKAIECDRLAALEERIAGRIASAVVDELDRRGWTAAAPTTECVHCEGTGWDPETTPGIAGETCWQCGGRGQA